MHGARVVALGVAQQAIGEAGRARDAENVSQTTYWMSPVRSAWSGFRIGSYDGLRLSGFGLTESP